MDRDLQKQKVFTLFSNQCAARGFNSFSKSGPSCKKLAHPCSKLCYMLSIRYQINNSKSKEQTYCRFPVWPCYVVNIVQNYTIMRDKQLCPAQMPELR